MLKGMKIALLKRKLSSLGGSEKYLKAVLSALVRRGLQPILFSSEPPKGEIPSGVLWRRVPTLRLGKSIELLSYNLAAISLLRRENPSTILSFDKTLVHTHLRLGGGIHRAWLRRKERIVGRWARPLMGLTPYHRAVLEIERRGLRWRSLQLIIANSEMVKAEAVNFYNLDPRKVVVVPNGVEWESLGEPFRQALSSPKDSFIPLEAGGFTFLFVGNGFLRKGLLQAILALKRLPQRARLIVVGRDSKMAHYKALGEKMGLKGRVFFVGEQRDPLRFYQGADAFVLPTLYDPFSNATLEALAMGLYVVTTKDNGCSEVMAPFAGTIVEDPLDVESVAEAMRRAMETPRDRVKIRESVAHLTLEAQVSKLIDLCLGG